MNHDLSNIKDKLIKLLSLAEDGAASQGEIDNALSLATQIMAKHNLTREDIDLSSSNPAKNVVMNRASVQCLNANASTWEDMLVRFCAEFVGNIGRYKHKGCYGINKTKKVTLYFFYGSQDEVEIAVELFRELQSAISIMAVTRFDSFYSKKGGAYSEGFVQGLELNLHSEKLKLQDDSATHALILKSDETSLIIIDQAKVWLKENHGVSLMKGQGTRGASGGPDARAQGKHDGSKYSVEKGSIRKKLN